MSILRIGGIASGFDTEQIVRDLMRIERMKVDKLYQNRQVIEWKKEQFREVINGVRSFRDKYFDVLRPGTNMMSASTLRQVRAVSSDADIVSVVAGADARVGSSTFQVFQSASAANAVGQGVSQIKSFVTVTSLNITEGKNTIQVTLNGVTEDITIDAGDYTSLEKLIAEIQGELDAAFGEGRVLVEEIAVGEGGSGLRFTPYASDSLVLSSGTYYKEGQIDGEDILAVLGITSGMSNSRLNLNDTMETVCEKLGGGLAFNEGDGSSFTLTINGAEIFVNKTDTLKTVIDRINNSDAGVRASYSAFSDSFSVTALETGAGYLTTDDGGGFFSALGIAVDGETGNIGESGRNAVFEINGVRDTRGSNTFTVEGITYTINRVVEEGSPSAVVNISTEINTDGIYEVIENFVNDYNSLIEEINGKLNEELFRDFHPLTDEQKESMSEKEVELWEEKAKSGMLRREPALENMLREMRGALYDMVGDFHLTEIGIQTSNNYRDQGKLVLVGGGSVLREAIASDPDKVAEIFTRRSRISYSANLTAEERAQRYEESGLAHRLSDILNENIRTTRDSNGRKGILLERAGIEGDITQYNNYYDRQINDVNKRIDRMNEMLFRKEEQYYRQFAAMEKALQQLYSQGDWLMMQLSQFQS
ncbi:MAG TPA: flagellar filament capping protein FliD [Firmicutes bacterium]|nr:flagellar filament capping protein FliD [Bacillota bacterium]